MMKNSFECLFFLTSQLYADHHKLSISEYQRSNYFYVMPEFVISPGNKLRLSHYTNGWSETVLF